MALFKNKQRDGGAKKRRRPHPIRFVRSHSKVMGRISVVVLTLLLCLVPVLFINNAMSYVPLMAVIFLIGISYGYLRLLRGSLEYSESSLIKSCERGEEVELAVEFKNKSFLVFTRVEPHFYISDLFGNVAGTMVSSMALMPFEERTFHFDAQFEHIGTYSAGVKRIIVSDLLGLFSYTIENHEEHNIDVLPKLFEVDNIALSNVSVQESRKAFQPIVTDDMDYAGVRDYEPGDPLKTIHWKLSAQKWDDSYYTRLFETFGNPGISIVLDTTAPEYDDDSLMQVFDGVVESALSVNEYARNCGVDSELCYVNSLGDYETAHVLNFVESSDTIQAIPRITVAPGDSALELYKCCYMGIHGQGNIAYVTSHVNDDIVTALLEARLRQRTPLLFVVAPRALEGDARKKFLVPLRRLDAAGITYYIVGSAQDLSSAGEASAA